MNDGYYWFIAALFTLGLAAGIMLVQIIGRTAAKWAFAVTLIFTIIAVAKFIYTPVRGVEDDQEMK